MHAVEVNPGGLAWGTRNARHPGLHVTQLDELVRIAELLGAPTAPLALTFAARPTGCWRTHEQPGRE